MTVGSLAVPALLSIQNTSGSSSALFWVTWGLSLAVTTANGIMTLFKLDRRFFTLHATAERLRSETWQFVQLAGRYSGHHGHPHRPTHPNQFVFYCSQLEKINMKRVDEEYIKTGEEKVTHLPPSTAAPGQKQIGDTMVPSPPEKLLSPMGESITLVEEDDEMGYPKEETNAKGSTLSLSEQPGQPMSPTGTTGLNLLSGSQNV